MSAATRKRLRDRYDWDGKSTAGLTRLIIESNYNAMAERALSRDKKALDSGFKGVVPKRGSKKLTFPGAEEFLADSKLLSARVEGSGKLLSEARQRAISDAVADAIRETGASTTRGTVPKNLHKIAERMIREAYAPYVKIDPDMGSPVKVHQVAVTESRILVNNLRRAYAEAASKEAARAGYELARSWVHNDGLSKSARGNHKAMHGRRAVNGFYNLKGADGRTYKISGPHDAALPAGEVVNCNCEENMVFVRRE